MNNFYLPFFCFRNEQKPIIQFYLHSHSPEPCLNISNNKFARICENNTDLKDRAIEIDIIAIQLFNFSLYLVGMSFDNRIIFTLSFHVLAASIKAYNDLMMGLIVSDAPLEMQTKKKSTENLRLFAKKSDDVIDYINVTYSFSPSPLLLCHWSFCLCA